jgi:hypothetical protein
VIIAILTYIGDKLLDSLAGSISDDLLAKLKGDPARKAFKKALGTAITRFAQLPGQQDLTAALVSKRGFLQEDDVVAEIGHLIRFDRPPDVALVAARWQAAVPDAPAGTDFTAAARTLLALLAEELRATDVFRPVFDSKKLDDIAGHGATSDAALAGLGTQLDQLYELISGTSATMIRALAGLEVRKQIRDRTDLIGYLTAGFTGRQAALDAVASFIRDTEGGYLEIRGDPGIGKSALAARLVAVNGYIHHFNTRVEGYNTPEAFLSNVCAQLITEYDLPYQTLPDEAIRDASFLSRLLSEAVAARPGQPVVIVVDALDEVDDATATAGRNPLYLPVTLPTGVYVILTSQPWRPPLTAYCRYETYALRADSPDNLADARAYIRQTLAARAAARAVLARQSVSETDLTEQLVRKSEGSFMYLHYILEDLAKPRYTGDLADLPTGLAAYYSLRWRWIQDGAPGDSWFVQLLPTVTVLAAVRDAVSIGLLMTFTQIPDRARVSAALDAWMPFLHSTEVQDDGKTRRRYRIFHSSFLDFVASRDEVDIRQAHRRIAEILIADILDGQP